MAKRAKARSPIKKRKASAKASAEDKILQKERALKAEEERILGMEARIKEEERRILREEEEIISEEKKIEKREEEMRKKEEAIQEFTQRIDQEITDIPLKRLSVQDIYKATVGAFLGVVAHYAFAEGLHVAEELSMTRATFILIVSYFIGVMLIDKSGFRKVREQRVLKIIPLRVTVIYFISLLVIIAINILFNQFHLDALGEAYRSVAATSLLAMIGSASADMIGHDHG